MSKFSVDKTAHDLVVAKLASSGLTPEDGDALGMRGLSGAETHACCEAFKPLRTLFIPYYDPAGLDETDHAGSPPFYRLRYLEREPGFAQLAEKDTLKYVQLPNTLPVAYYPRLAVNWIEICQDVDQPLIITEGELKAAKACKEGFPTIGLGGVHSFRSNQHGIDWITSLTYVEWVKRNVYICYDSDLRTNKGVQGAIRDLTDMLDEHGAFVHLTKLPEIGGHKKIGLDDFFVLKGETGPHDFRRLLKTSETYGAARTLFAINQERIYIEDPGLVINLRTGSKTAPSAFKEHVGSKRRYLKHVMNNDGSLRTERISAAKEWIDWPFRHEADYLTYHPGAEREFLDARGHRVYNTWMGWGCEPKKGDVSLFLQLVDHLFTGADKGAKEWFLKWCAWPIKYPATKLFSSVVVYGREQGTGKTLIGQTLGKVYGKENYEEITQGHLHNSFNEWAESKQFVMGDDVTGSDKRQDNDLLKKLITQQQMRVNVKYIKSYVVPDFINYYFTSNQPNAFFLEDTDRRFFIHQVDVGPLPEDFYIQYGMWLESTLGPPAMFHYLLNLNTDDFNPTAPAFKTTAKVRMIADSQSDLGTWVRVLKDDPDMILRIGETVLKRDLWSAKELLHFYDPEGKHRVTAGGLGKELGRAGFNHVMRGLPIRVPKHHAQGRYYIVRNHDRWISSSRHVSLKDVLKHIEETELLPPPSPPKY